MKTCHNSRLDITHFDFQLVNATVRSRYEIWEFITKYRLHESMHMGLSFQRLRNAPIKSSFYHTRTRLPLPGLNLVLHVHVLDVVLNLVSNGESSSMKVHVQVPSHLDLVPEGTVLVLDRYLVPAGRHGLNLVLVPVPVTAEFRLDRRLQGDSLLLLNFAYCSFRILQECNAELDHTAEFECRSGAILLDLYM